MGALKRLVREIMSSGPVELRRSGLCILATGGFIAIWFERLAGCRLK